MRQPPRTRSIFWTESACYPLVCVAVAILLLTLGVKVTGTLPGRRGRPGTPVDPETASWILSGGIAAALALSAIAARRVARVRRLFEDGHQVEATVEKVLRYRGGSTLRLEFSQRGEVRRARAKYVRWRQTPSFEQGMRISLLVDRDDPRRVVPLALYERDPLLESGTSPAALARR